MTYSPAAPTAFGTPATLSKDADGKGVYVYDAAGKQNIDGSGGPSLFCVGHGHPEVGEIIDKFGLSLKQVFNASPGNTNDP